MKLMGILNEGLDFDKLTKELYQIKMDNIEITNVNIVVPQNFEIVKKRNIEFYLKATQITPDTINIFYSKVVEILKQKGLEDSLNEWTLSIKNILFYHSNVFTMDWNKFIPTHIINDAKFSHPTSQMIDRGQYSLVLPQNPVTNDPENIDKVIAIKTKNSKTYYAAFKKGKIDLNDVRHTYELEDDYVLNVRYKGGFRKTLELNDFAIDITTSFKSIDGIPKEHESFPRELYSQMSDQVQKIFSKFKIDIGVYN
jgi:hypothetical protein